MKEQDKLIKIGKEVADAFKEIKEVKSIAFYGAIANGFADKYSDVDIVVLCSNVPSPEKRKNAFLNSKITYNKSHDIKEINSYQDSLTYKKISIGISYKPISYIGEKIKKVRFIGYLTRDDALLLNWIYFTKEIYDPKRNLLKYKGILRKYIKDTRILIKLYWQQLQDIFKKGLPHGTAGIEAATARKNIVWVNKLISMLLDRYLFVLYAVNNKYYNEFSQKWAFKEIKDFKYKPKNCIKKLERISILGNRSKELKEKLRIFRSLVGDTRPFIKKRLK